LGEQAVRPSDCADARRNEKARPSPVTGGVQSNGPTERAMSRRWQCVTSISS
jgi:hypothetical protein